MKNCLCKITAFLLALIILTSCTNNTNSSSVNKTESSTTADTTVTTSDTQATTTTTAETSATTTATTAATTAAPTKPATTKPTTAATTPSPAKVVMPTVKIPTSPGTEAYSGGGGVIDVSNKSQGYFSAKYTGSNPTIKVLVTKDGAKFQYNLRTDNQAEYFPLQAGNGTYKIQVLENTSGTSYAVVVQQDVSVSLSSSLSPFLYPNQKVNFSQGSACVKKSAELCAGKTSDIDKIGAIFKFVTSTVTYDTAEAAAIGSGAITNYTPFPDEVLSTRKGICYDYASLFAAMTRAQGIPTKLVMGYVPVNGQSLYHAWNEIYTNETGWIVVEFKAVPGFNTLDPTFYASGNKISVASRFTDKNYYKVSKVF